MIVTCEAAMPCALPEQGRGHVAAIIDGRTLRLDDGREIRLAGLELPPSAAGRQQAAVALAVIADGKLVTLSGTSDAPDRYGRQVAFVVPAGGDAFIQALLLAQGVALMTPQADATCLPSLLQAEEAARSSRRGIWADLTALKNAERPGDILAAIGQFGVVEGKVLSVREAGAVTYVNFGRRWTEDFALTFSKRTVAAFEDAKIPVRSLENRRVRVRGWIGVRGGPRIEVFRVEQIDVLGENASRSGQGRVPGN